MPSRHESFNVDAPAGTAKAAPLEVATRVAPGHLRQLKLVIPNNPLAGIGFAYAHQIVIPATGSGFILGSTTSQNLTFDLDDYPAGGQWSAFVFNTDVSDSVFGVHMALDEVAVRRQPRQREQLSPVAIYAAAG